MTQTIVTFCLKNCLQHHVTKFLGLVTVVVSSGLPHRNGLYLLGTTVHWQDSEISRSVTSRGRTIPYDGKSQERPLKRPASLQRRGRLQKAMMSQAGKLRQNVFQAQNWNEAADKTCEATWEADLTVSLYDSWTLWTSTSYSSKILTGEQGVGLTSASLLKEASSEEDIKQHLKTHWEVSALSRWGGNSLRESSVLFQTARIPHNNTVMSTLLLSPLHR